MTKIYIYIIYEYIYNCFLIELFALSGKFPGKLELIESVPSSQAHITSTGIITNKKVYAVNRPQQP